MKEGIGVGPDNIFQAHYSFPIGKIKNMEIPSSLKRLYRHWNFHTKHNTTPRKEMGQKIPDNIKQFIRERIASGNVKL